MNARFIQSKALESVKVVILFLSCMKNFDASIFWPALLKPRKSFSDISKEIVGLEEQLNAVNNSVDNVVSKRNSTLNGNEVICDSGGRFLIYSALHATMDALASGETSGFFDDSDAPPWMTWVDFVSFIDVDLQQYEGYLIAWIPRKFIPIAQAGIDVCLGGSLFWADDFEEVRTYGKNAVSLCNEVSMIVTIDLI